MVVAMDRRPPERTRLPRATPKPAQHKLKPATGLERAMGKIAMVASRDAEHLNDVDDATQNQRRRSRTTEDHRKAGDVQKNEDRQREPADLPWSRTRRRFGLVR